MIKSKTQVINPLVKCYDLSNVFDVMIIFMQLKINRDFKWSL